MRVILVNPSLYQDTVRRLRPITENLFYNSAPLGLGYLAAVLEKQKHDVRIIDAPVEGLSIAKVTKRVADFSPDMVGITTHTISVLSSYELARRIRERLPGVKIVVGGPHITSRPHELRSHPELDFAVIGEGEVTLAELTRAIEKGQDFTKVKGIAYSAGDEVFFTPAREFISKLDSLPNPARHLLPMHRYKPQPNDQKRLPKMSMISSRGCPYNCIFCDKKVFKNIYRSFSPEYVVREISRLVDEFHARDIAFVDSTFTPSRERVYGIIEELKKSDLDITWTCSVRADVLDRQLLKDMKDAGCWRIRLGIESGNEEVLKFIKKGITKAQVRKVVNLAYELDLEPKGFFMLGHLNDTKETMEETINFACSLPLKDITVQLNTPLEGTPQHRLIYRYGRLLTRDVSYYDFWEPVFIPKGISHRQLRKYYAKFYLKFYLRPRIWYRHIKKIRSVSDIKKYLEGLKIIFFFLMVRLRASIESKSAVIKRVRKTPTVNPQVRSKDCTHG